MNNTKNTCIVQKQSKNNESLVSLPMPAPCPSTIPSWYLPTLHIIAVISFPINILGLYLVFYKSPGISKYKYCILYIQAASFLTEIQISVVSPGIYFFPLLAGISTTITEGWIIGPHTITVFWFFFLGNELPAIVWSFVYRHNAAEDMNRVTKHSRIVKKLALVASHLFPFLVCFSFYMSAITKEEARVYLLKNYPQCLFWLDSPNFTMYDWRTNPWVAVAGVGALIYVSLFASYAFSLGFRTMILLHKLRSHMSPQTYSQHKTALIGLFLQVLIPSFLIILPLFICFWVISTDQVEHQELASNSLNLICFHSVSSTIVMIAGNPRYRRTCAGYCRLRVDLRRKTTVAVEPSSTNLRRSISIR